VTPTNKKKYLKPFTYCYVKPDNDPLEMKCVCFVEKRCFLKWILFC